MIKNKTLNIKIILGFQINFCSKKTIPKNCFGKWLTNKSYIVSPS